MFTDPSGPIEHFTWGKFQIRGGIHSAEGEGVGKDVCLLGEDVIEWAERQGHRLKPEMVACALNQDLSILVIGIGVHGRLRVPRKTREAIKASGIETLIIEKTPDACETFNRLFRAGQQVGLLAHGTC